MRGQMSNFSKMFSLMSTLTNPDSSENNLIDGIAGLEQSCSDVRKQHFEMESKKKEVDPLCQVCHEKFDYVSNMCILKNKKLDMTCSERNKELREAYGEDDVGAQQRRVVLSCGHDTYHVSCIQEWIKKSKHKACPECRQPITNTNEFE